MTIAGLDWEIEPATERKIPLIGVGRRGGGAKSIRVTLSPEEIADAQRKLVCLRDRWRN